MLLLALAYTAGAQQADEKYRPLYPFQPRKGLDRDPDGLVYTMDSSTSTGGDMPLPPTL